MASGNDNPWSDQRPSHQQGIQPSDNLIDLGTQNPWQLGGNTARPEGFRAPSDPWANQQQSVGYAPPAGPPPGQSRGQAPQLPDETARFVSADERGEQREALEHFEMSHHAQLSPDERNIEQLCREFPKLDGALVAAMYGDSKDMGASREM